MTSPPAPQRRRADARRSRAAILDAAVQLLNERPDVSVEVIASAAGVTRQTVYAHFPSREELLEAAVDRVTEETVGAMDAAGLDEESAAEALCRLIEVSRRMSERYPVLLQMPVSPQADQERHAPVADRLRRIILRGQESGEFDRRLSTDWLVAATIALGHAAGDEAGAGRMSGEQADAALRLSLLRLYGAAVE
ncbi:TetR/AcrR family transcriptional regulator [Nonomuraea dietziae]|uniref:TetR/AcrR family transcriptional regulator n=1 Tax=Nonomuraea dietziae TaxID=65515 RepID=UPI00340A8C39